MPLVGAMFRDVRVLDTGEAFTVTIKGRPAPEWEIRKEKKRLYLAYHNDLYKTDIHLSDRVTSTIEAAMIIDRFMRMINY